MTFAPWFTEGKPIPVMHPTPWVYAEVYFPEPDIIEWRLYDYAEDEITVERFEWVSDRTGEIPPDYWPEEPAASET
jgi:hypothetical protein